MKKTIFTLSLIMACILIFASCKTKSAVAANGIPYVEANGYFVKNDAPTIPKGKITTQEEFYRFFGEAATMTSRPTQIDFQRQFVIAVSQKPTDRSTTYSPVALTKEDGKLVFAYHVSQGDRQSYTIQPLLLIVVDKKYEADVQCKLQ